MNWLVVYYHYGKDSREFREHVKRNLDFLWMGPEGMMMNGTNGSQLWDCSFIIQALAEAQLADVEVYRQHMIKALEFMDITQVNTFKRKNLDVTENIIFNNFKFFIFSIHRLSAICLTTKDVIARFQRVLGLSVPVTRATPFLIVQQKVSRVQLLCKVSLICRN